MPIFWCSVILGNRITINIQFKNGLCIPFVMYWNTLFYFVCLYFYFHLTTLSTMMNVLKAFIIIVQFFSLCVLDRWHSHFGISTWHSRTLRKLHKTSTIQRSSSKRNSTKRKQFQNVNVTLCLLTKQYETLWNSYVKWC